MLPMAGYSVQLICTRFGVRSPYNLRVVTKRHVTDKQTDRQIVASLNPRPPSSPTRRCFISPPISPSLDSSLSPYSHTFIIGNPSPTHSFTLGLNPSFSANPPYRSLSFVSFKIHYMDFLDCLLLLLSISVFLLFSFFPVFTLF